MDVRSILRNLRVWIGCRLSGRWYTQEDCLSRERRIDALYREVDYHPLGCEFYRCDRIATYTVIAENGTKWQACRVCRNALEQGIQAAGSYATRIEIPQPEELRYLIEKELLPPSKR